MLERHAHAYRVRVLAAAGCLVSGYALSLFNPMVKRLWTASFTLASAGCVFAIPLFFYWVAEMREQRRLVFPLVVVGMNSIFIYGLHMILWDWFNASTAVFTGGYSFLGTAGPGCAVDHRFLADVVPVLLALSTQGFLAAVSPTGRPDLPNSLTYSWLRDRRHAVFKTSNASATASGQAGRARERRY